jgi:general secretion pathway protein M
MSESPAASRVAAALQKMTDRERKLVFLTAGVAAILVVVGVGWGISGAIAKREKQIQSHKEEIAQLEALRADYDAAVARSKAAENRIKSAASTSLFSLLQKSAADVGLSLSDLNERRLPIKDSELTEVTVDVTLKEITVDKLVTLLEKIEGRSSGGVVKVQKLKVKTRFDNPEVLEASLTVSTWKAPASSASSGATPAEPSAAIGAPQ